MTIYTPVIVLRAILLVSILWVPGYSQVFPKPANFEDVPVYRLQLAVETANVGDAGTDDRVFVVFNTRMKGYYDRPVHVPALVIPVNELRVMIESIVGNQIRYISDRTVNWGSKSGINTIWGEAVEFSFKNPNRLSVDLDLQVAHLGPNSELDVDFDIVVNCEANKVTLNLENFRARADFLNLIPVKRIKENLLKNLNRTYSNVPICNVYFEQNGTLKLL